MLKVNRIYLVLLILCLYASPLMAGSTCNDMIGKWKYATPNEASNTSRKTILKIVKDKDGRLKVTEKSKTTWYNCNKKNNLIVVGGIGYKKEGRYRRAYFILSDDHIERGKAFDLIRY